MDIKLEKSEDELKMLAIQVLKEYSISPEDIQIIQSGSIKTVWKIKDKNRVFCLKRLKQTLDKVLFSVNAQIYIKKSGGNVPEVSINKHGEPITIVNEQLFVVYEWLNGRDLNFDNQKDLSLAMEGLAKFHVSSKGYVPKEDARVSTKLGKWPNQYESMKNKLVAWKEIAKSKGTSEHQAYLKHVSPVVEIAEEAIVLLKKSRYCELASMESSVPVLCHQDYGKGNAIYTDKGIIVLDLDGVTYDLPARDLRKIIGKRAENHGRWEAKNIDEVLDWYSSVNPIGDDVKKALFIDLLFPHWFFGLVKNQYDNFKTLKSSEIEKIAKLEISKVPILKELMVR